jgi:hypothetical protein
VLVGDTCGIDSLLCVSQFNVNYEIFLMIWKDADPDIPILKEAKAEYTKLQ